MSDGAAIAIAFFSALPYSVRKRLCEKWNGAQGLLEAVRAGKATTPEEEKAFDVIKRQLDRKRAEAELQKLKKMGAWVIGFQTEAYPKHLSEISDPPLALFGMGELPKDENRFLGFVGPRKPSTYGARIARLLAEDLAREGIVLVSGLARGVDAIAHEAAVKQKTPTIAVTACGLDRVYPPEHALLASKIRKCGTILSEFPLQTPPRAEHFPRRNRIIAGLSRGLLLVEAGERSGARITARHAMEQSREVYAVPGPIDSPLSMHPNQLISQGAKLVATSEDVLEDFVPGYKGQMDGKHKPEATLLSKEEVEFLSGMERDQPRSAQELVSEFQLSVQEVLQTLLELEIKGFIVKQPDARYVRIVGEV